MRLKKTIIGILASLLLVTIAILFIPSINKKVYHLLINSMLDKSVPYIYSNNLSLENDIILDTRTLEEYKVSHIPNAIWIEEANLGKLEIEKSAKVIVYCSLGKRSEILGEKLIANGYTNVYNLYGGIIEWHNNDLISIDSSKNITDQIHPYSWFWGLWIW